MQIISANIDRIKNLCASHNVDTMYVFGSALRSDFNVSSDVDFLVKFKPGNLAEYFDNYMSFRQSLKNLLGREIDLVEEQTLKNPILITSINRNKELIYG